MNAPTVAMRTGDTEARDRRAIQRRPPDILITTPESLYLMLTSQAREILRSIRWVILDPTKVGMANPLEVPVNSPFVQVAFRSGQTTVYRVDLEALGLLDDPN